MTKVELNSTSKITPRDRILQTIFQLRTLEFSKYYPTQILIFLNRNKLP